MITIDVSGDTNAEPDEEFTITLSNPTGSDPGHADGDGDNRQRRHTDTHVGRSTSVRFPENGGKATGTVHPQYRHDKCVDRYVGKQ